MKNDIVNNGTQGKLYCPGCQAKIGHFCWFGEQIHKSNSTSTGYFWEEKEPPGWLAPAFNVVAKKVDKIKLFKEIGKIV